MDLLAGVDPPPACGIIDKTDLSVSVCGYADPKAALGKNVIDWKGYRAKVKARAADMRALVPGVMTGYSALATSGDKAQHLDAKTRELISLAVAVTTRCDGCIASHVEAAIGHGATREELAEALGVAIAMNAGAALVYSTRALDCYAAMAPSTATVAG